MGNIQTSQSNKSQNSDFSVPLEINISFLNVHGIEDTEEQPCKTIYLVLPIFDKPKYEIRKSDQKITVVVVGDGDYQLNSNFIDFLKSLSESGRKVDTLILNDLNIEPEGLKEALEFLKEDLISLKLTRVSFDQAHIEVLNGMKMNLKYLSLAHVLPDDKNIFDEKNSGKNTNIDLDLTNLGPGIKYLDLKGISLNSTIQKGIENLDALEHLFLEDLVGNKSQNLEFIKSILANLYRFPHLNTLSFAGNNLSTINFVELQQNSQKPIFPPTLQKLNLNSTNMNNDRIQGLTQLLKSSQAKLNALSLSKCRAYSDTIKGVEEYIKSMQNPDFQYQRPVRTLKVQENKDILGDLTADDSNPEKKIATITTEEQEIKAQMLRGLIKFMKNLTDFIDESRKQENPTGLAQIAKLNTANQYLPIILKDAAGIKSFLNSCKYNIVQFSRDLKSLIPKNNFKLALKYPKTDLDKTVEVGGEDSIGEYQIPFIQQIDLERISDKQFAYESMQVQRDKFLSLMAESGYKSTEIELSDGIEDVFKVILDDSKYIGWDFRMAFFSVIWRFQYHTVSVKFNLSDDCFMKREDRTNVYKVSNQDYLIDILSTLNLKPLDFVGELEVLADGETEVNIRCSIMKYGPLNLAKLLLVAIDKGFVFLRVLQEKNIFDHEDSSAVEEDARQIRKAVKAELKAYAESEEFLQYIRSDNV